jgi:hypothetical protein
MPTRRRSLVQVIADLKRIEDTARKLRLELTAALRGATRKAGTKRAAAAEVVRPVLGGYCPPPK